MHCAKACARLVLVLVAGTAAAPGWSGFTGVGWDGPGQGAASLGFNIVGPGTPDLEDERRIIISALENWVNVAMVDIMFNEVAQPGLPDSLDFRFTRMGSSAGELGFAFFPDDIAPEPMAGDVYLDEAESWTSQRIGPGTCTFSRCDLYYVVLHEIGHSLGLTHRSDLRNTPPARVMNPFFNPVFGSVPGFGAFDTIQPPDVADLCSAYSCSGAGFVQPLGATVPVPEPPAGVLFLAGLLAIVVRTATVDWMTIWNMDPRRWRCTAMT